MQLCHSISLPRNANINIYLNLIIIYSFYMDLTFFYQTALLGLTANTCPSCLGLCCFFFLRNLLWGLTLAQNLCGMCLFWTGCVSLWIFWGSSAMVPLASVCVSAKSSSTRSGERMPRILSGTCGIDSNKMHMKTIKDSNSTRNLIEVLRRFTVLVNHIMNRNTLGGRDNIP